MPRQISDPQLSRLSEYITGWLGLHFPKKRWGDLERIICHVAPELGFEDTDACIERLLSGQFAKEHEEILAGHLILDGAGHDNELFLATADLGQRIAAFFAGAEAKDETLATPLW